MRAYDVYAHADGDGKAVASGFSWPAFLVGPAWAFLNRLWWPMLLMALIEGYLAAAALAAAGVLEGRPGDAGPATLPLLAALFLFHRFVVGRLAHGWQRNRLLDRGYRLVAQGVGARSDREAVTTVMPELIRAHPWVKRALALAARGENNDAAIVLERIVREGTYDRNMVRFAEAELRRIERRRRESAEEAEAGPG